MTTLREPPGLAKKGSRLWREMTELTTYNAVELTILEEICRISDRLDKLADAIDGKELVSVIETYKDGEFTVIVDKPLAEARQQANQLKQLYAALRVPDEKTGERPQHRTARGAYKPRGSSAASVSALDRLRQASGA